MAFDGFFTRVITNELNTTLLNGRVEKIYHPDKNDLVIFIHANNSKHKLYISCDTSHTGLYLTDENFQNPTHPSSFCMLLRKHLQNSRILSIRQKDWERIVEITFETRNELAFISQKKLIIEIMGKHSNVILVENSSNKIIDSIKRISFDSSRVRQIFPGGTYTYPPSKDKIFPNATDDLFFSNLSSYEDLLNKVQGLSPILSKDIFEDKNPRHKLLDFVNLINSSAIAYSVYFDEDNKPLDFHVLPISYYMGMPYISFSSASEIVRYYYSHRESSNRIKQKSSDLYRHVNSLLKKFYLKKQRLSEDLIKAKNSDKYKLYGELLTANLHLVPLGSTKAEVTNYYDNSKIIIPLDKKYHPSKNAQIYFKKYAKARTAINEKNIQLKNVNDDILYLEQVLNFIDMAKDIDTIDGIRQELIDLTFLKYKKNNNSKKQKQIISPYTYKTSKNGFRVSVGRNNKENDILTMKEASKSDIWFHTKDIPGSHTILFTDGMIPEEDDIVDAASIAAYHSKGKNSENVPVDYTYIRYIKKPKGAKPGMVTFTNNKTLYVKPSIDS